MVSTVIRINPFYVTFDQSGCEYYKRLLTSQYKKTSVLTDGTMLLSGATSISGANFSYFRLSDNDDLYHCNALSSSRSAEKQTGDS
jgi:hypothetical protein